MEKQINLIISDILSTINPHALILFHQKIGNSGKVLGFKICIVIDTNDKLEIEKNIYKSVDSDIPFDILIYTTMEWDKLKNKKSSFAHQIFENGVLVHGQK